MIRVLILSIVPSPYQRDFFEALSKIEGLDIRVRYAEAASPDSPWPKSELKPYEKVYKSFWISWGGKRFIINRQLPDLKNIDCVIVNGFITVPAQIMMRFRGRSIPFIFWGEKMIGKKSGLKGIVHRILTAPLENAAAVVAIGKGAARDYSERYPDKPLYQIPYTCDISKFREHKPKRPRNPVQILFCGQMIARKGVDLLITAFEQVLDEGHSAELILVGREAELPEMLEGVSQQTKEKIKYEGFKAPEDLPEVYSNGDIFVLPSRYDGWGVVVNQALGAGLPVICSDAVGSAESLIDEGENGYIFKSGEIGELRDCLISLISDHEKLAAFSRASLSKSTDVLPESAACKWKEIIVEATGSINAH